MGNSLHKKIEAHAAYLKLRHLSEIYENLAEKSAISKLSHVEFLSLILEAEVQHKKELSVDRRIKQAKFPYLKTMEGFNFSFQPCLNEKEVLHLSGLNFMEHKQNVIFLGPPGVGKTHLATALGIKACSSGYRVEFRSSTSLISELALAEKKGELIQTLMRFSRLHLMIIDEMGYMPISNHEANLLFQLVSILYEKVSVILTSNFNFDEWSRFFQDSIVATAIVDRIVHHGHLFFINGASYRIKEKIKKSL
jgi:DNA replication protein DnaC